MGNDGTKRYSGGAPRHRFRKAPCKASLNHTVESWFKVNTILLNAANCIVCTVLSYCPVTSQFPGGHCAKRNTGCCIAVNAHLSWLLTFGSLSDSWNECWNVHLIRWAHPTSALKARPLTNWFGACANNGPLQQRCRLLQHARALLVLHPDFVQQANLKSSFRTCPWPPQLKAAPQPRCICSGCWYTRGLALTETSATWRLFCCFMVLAKYRKHTELSSTGADSAVGHDTRPTAHRTWTQLSESDVICIDILKQAPPDLLLVLVKLPEDWQDAFLQDGYSAAPGPLFVRCLLSFERSK